MRILSVGASEDEYANFFLNFLFLMTGFLCVLLTVLKLSL